jgi:adenine-specific DNA-methyltransferase
VRDKLKVRDELSKAYLNRFERLLIQLTRHELNGHAEFLSDGSFRLRASPFPGDIPPGLYELPRRSGEAHLYRLGHPLAEAVIRQAKSRDLPAAEVRFSYEDHDGKVSALEPFVGQSGWLTLSAFTVESLDQAEDHLIFAAVTDTGTPLNEETAARLFTLPGKAVGTALPAPLGDTLTASTQQRQAAIQRTISERNARFFEAEAEKLDGWADDLKLGLEREIKEIDRLIKEARRAATIALTLEEKLAGQRQIKTLESQRNEKRRSLFEAQDEVDKQREELIGAIEGKLVQRVLSTNLFILRWCLR